MYCVSLAWLKISHIQKEEDNYEKQIEDLIQKTDKIFLIFFLHIING